MSGERISVVMVSFHTGPVLFEAVRAVLADPGIAELVLVDNGNPADIRRALMEAFGADDRVRLLQGHGNIGFARACNYGADVSTGDAVLFLNPDAILETGAAKRMLDAGRASGYAPWLSGGRLVDERGVEQRGSRRGKVDLLSVFLAFTLLDRLPGIRSYNHHRDPLPEEPVPMPTVSGAVMMLDRASIEAVGGFDAGYFLHVEDIALCRAVREAGGGVVFEPDARARHYGATSEAPALAVEWHKVRGFYRYFWTGRPVGSKLGIVLLGPFIAAAILGRALLSR